jgi:4-hydroxybenzoate polyprenyltransferase
VLSLIREIIKDTEDMRGDGKFDCKTIPIVLGVRKTKKVLVYTTLFLALGVILFAALATPSYSFQYSFSAILLFVYLIIAVTIPIAILAFRISRADTTRDFSALSSLSKLIMLAGMLSMIGWKF